jgi:hypothetical protein
VFLPPTTPEGFCKCADLLRGKVQRLKREKLSGKSFR